MMNSKIVHIMFFHIITIVKCFRLSTVFGTATNYYGNYKITVFNVSILKWYPSNILQPTELSMFFFFLNLLVISFFNLMQFIVKKKNKNNPWCLYMVCMSESLFHVFIQSILQQSGLLHMRVTSLHKGNLLYQLIPIQKGH